MQRRSGVCGSQEEPSAARLALNDFRANKRECGSIKRIDGGCLAEGRENRKIRRARRQATGRARINKKPRRSGAQVREETPQEGQTHIS